MIASPGDVADERAIIQNAIYQWNATHATDRKVVLLPVAWETHSSPQMGDRPQAIINKQILFDCDILVAAFWTRIGSRTGAAQSGTVEEIQEHLAAGKEALIYFSNAPVRLDSVDSAQYEALRAFKQTCRTDGLVADYETLSEFTEKVTRNLAQTVIRLTETGGIPPTKEPTLPARLSSEAETLLAAAVEGDGSIMCVGTLEGLLLQVADKNYTEGANPREEAPWRAAVASLQQNGYIEDRTGMGQVFFLTHDGYQLAEAIAKQ